MTIEIKTRSSYFLRMLLFLPLVAAFFACQEEVEYEFVDSNLPESKFTAEVGWFDVTVKNSSYHSTNYKWDFGDGNVSAEANPEVYNYSKTGTYTITLTAFDNNGAFSEATQTVVISNDPVAKFSVNADFLTLSFINESSKSTTYSWDFGDGATSSEANPTHTYANAGNYTVSLTSSNDGGASNTLTTEIAVKSFAPVILNPSFEATADHGAKDYWEGEFSTTQGPTPPTGVNGCKLSGSGKSVYQTITVEANKTYALGFQYVTKATGTGFTVFIKDANDGSVIKTETVGLSPDANSYVPGSVQFDSGSATSITLGVEYLDVETRVDDFEIR